jgi:hypothetical protein
MTKLILKSYPATREEGVLSIAITAFGDACPVPQRTVEIVRKADAVAAFDAYCADVTATGKGAVVSMSIGRGDRAPSGFHQLPGAKTFHPVNI